MMNLKCNNQKKPLKREAGELYIANLLFVSQKFATDVKIVREYHKIYPMQGIWLSGKNYLHATKGFLFNEGKLLKVQPDYPISIHNLSQKYHIPKHLSDLISNYVGSGDYPDFLRTSFSYDLLKHEQKMQIKFSRKISTVQKNKAQIYVTKNSFYQLHKLIDEQLHSSKPHEAIEIPKEVNKKASIQAKKKTDLGVVLEATLNIDREKFGKAVEKNKKGNFKLSDQTFDRDLEAYEMAREGRSFIEIYDRFFFKQQTSYTKDNIKKWVEKMGLMIESLALVKAKK